MNKKRAAEASENPVEQVPVREISQESSMADCVDLANRAAAAAIEAMHRITDDLPPGLWLYGHAMALQILAAGAQFEAGQLRRLAAAKGLPPRAVPKVIAADP